MTEQAPQDEFRDGRVVLPQKLLEGISEALEGKHFRLRMDPQDLADRIGGLIDFHVERLRRLRAAYEQSHTTHRKLTDRPTHLGGRVGLMIGNAPRPCHNPDFTRRPRGPVP